MNPPILVPLDGSALAEQALGFAEAIAEASGSPLLLLCASYVAGLPGLDVADEQVKAVVDAERYLRRVASRLKKRGVAIEICAPYGKPGQAILREAGARRAWLIVMATHGRGGLDRVLYGSVTEGVVRQSPVPVLLARAWHSGDSLTRLRGTGPILVPLDGTIHAEGALPVARFLASVLQAKVILVQAIPPRDMALTPDRTAALPLTEDGPAEELGVEHYLQRFANALVDAGIDAETIVRCGEPSRVISAIVEERGASLAVLATHGRTGLDRLLIGSVAERIVRQGASPVLLVRPGHGGDAPNLPDLVRSEQAAEEREG